MENQLQSFISPKFLAAQQAAQTGAIIQQQIAAPAAAYLQQQQQREQAAVQHIVEQLTAARKANDPDSEAFFINEITKSPSALAMFDRYGATSYLKPVVKSKAQQTYDMQQKMQDEAVGQVKANLAAEGSPEGQQLYDLKQKREAKAKLQQLLDIKAETGARLQAQFEHEQSPAVQAAQAKERLASMQDWAAKQKIQLEILSAKQKEEEQKAATVQEQKFLQEKIDTVQGLFNNDAFKYSINTDPMKFVTSGTTALKDMVGATIALQKKSQKPIDPRFASLFTDDVKTYSDAAPDILEMFKQLIRAPKDLSTAPAGTANKLQAYATALSILAPSLFSTYEYVNSLDEKAWDPVNKDYVNLRKEAARMLSDLKPVGYQAYRANYPGRSLQELINSDNIMGVP